MKVPVSHEYPDLVSTLCFASSPIMKTSRVSTHPETENYAVVTIYVLALFMSR